MRTLRIASRQSPLALWQARYVASLCQGAGYETVLLPLTTSGDLHQQVPLGDLQLEAMHPAHRTGKGLFVKEVQEALLDGRADLAVHSLKDLPVLSLPGIRLAYVPPRFDPRDVLVLHPACIPGGTLGENSLGEIVDRGPWGTSSPRRQWLLPALLGRPLPWVCLRGNLETRLRKLEEEGLTGTLLAAAGLERLGLTSRPGLVYLSPNALLPAPGQGALGVEVGPSAPALPFLVDRAASEATALERLCLRLLGGDCHMAVAAFMREGVLQFAAKRDQVEGRGAWTLGEGNQRILGELWDPKASTYADLCEALWGSSLRGALAAALESAGLGPLLVSCGR